MDNYALMPLGKNRVIAIFTVERKALFAALEKTMRVLIPEIPAAVALAQVAAKRAHVADLRPANIARSRRQGRTEFAQSGVVGDVRQVHPGTQDKYGWFAFEHLQLAKTIAQVGQTAEADYLVR